jgi:hypothetical protein
MFRQWEVAKKLCTFMLMYEPNNPEAKQYAPLIDYMLTKEESSSSSDEDDDDTSGKFNKNIFNIFIKIIYLDDENGSGKHSSSSSSSNEEEKPNDNIDTQAPKSVNGSFSRKCTHHQ